MPRHATLLLAAALACNARPADPAAPLTPGELAELPGRIFFLAEGPEGAAIALTYPSRQGLQTLLQRPNSPEGPTLFPGPLSPDGAHIVLVTVEELQGEHAERLELRPVDPDGALGGPLWTSPPAPQVRNPAWAPSGRFFVFEAAFESFRDIYRLDLGAPPTLTRLTAHPAGNYEPAVSPDERELAFVSSRDGNAEVYVSRIDGSSPRRLTRGLMDDWGPRWSPDGAQLAFLSNRERADRIYLCKPDGTDQRRLTRDGATSDFEPAEAEPLFTSDGRALLFSARTGPDRAAIRSADLASGVVTDLTPGAASDREPTGSPDGAFILFTSDRDGDPELYLMRRDGSRVTRLTERPGADWLARWAPR